jgi:hypothetical protein
MVNQVGEGGFRNNSKENSTQNMRQEQKKFDNHNNKNKSQTKLYNILGTVITGIIAPYFITINEPKILLETNQYIVAANSSTNLYEHFLGSKKDFKSLDIYSKNQNKTIGTWDSKSTAQHPGLKDIEPTTYTHDTKLCPGSDTLDSILFNCLNDIRNEALQTNSGKQFYQSLKK